MHTITKAAIGILLPFVGTGSGAATVFFLRRGMGARLRRLWLGFAAGVMLAASVWSLLIPSIEMASAAGMLPWLPALSGFLSGVACLILLDCLIDRLHPTRANRSLLMTAVTLHNVPEGMAVGVVLSGMLTQPPIVPIAEAMALSIGIAIQNFPEGAIVSAPLAAGGMSKRRAFLYGAASGAVEPIAALLTLLMTSGIAVILPFILAFAAGAMINVVVQELIPEMQEEGDRRSGIVGVSLGFAVMMLLDVALG